MMPSPLTASRTVPTAPLSRTDDATVIPSPCMACGAVVSGWAWINSAGTGVLIHYTLWGSEFCPSGECFDWMTGEPMTAKPEAVAA